MTRCFVLFLIEKTKQVAETKQQIQANCKGFCLSFWFCNTVHFQYISTNSNIAVYWLVCKFSQFILLTVGGGDTRRSMKWKLKVHLMLIGVTHEITNKPKFALQSYTESWSVVNISAARPLEPRQPPTSTSLLCVCATGVASLPECATAADPPSPETQHFSAS